MHGPVGAALAEHLVARRDVAEVSKRGLALGADKAFRAGWPAWKRCFNLFFLHFTVLDLQYAGGTFDLEEDPHDWLGAQEADLQNSI